MTVESIIGVVVSIITAIAAVTALFLSLIQISKSNKQALLDRRIKSLLLIKWMKALCEEHSAFVRDYLNKMDKGPLFTADLLFLLLTNTSFLEEIQPAINHVLESEWQRQYLLKIGEMKNLCEEVRLVFPKKIRNILSDFVFYYEEMLVALYKYQVAFNSIKEECIDSKKHFPDNNELENKCRNKVKKYVSGTFDLALKLTDKKIIERSEKYIRI